MPGRSQAAASDHRQVGGVFLQHRVEAARQAFDELIGAGELRRLHHLGEGRIALDAGNVLANGAAKQEIILQDKSEILAQMDQIELP